MKNVMLLLRELLSEKPTEVFSGEKARIAHLPSGVLPIFQSLFCLSEASHDWKSQASFHGLTHPCRAEPVKRRFPVAVFRYLPVRASTGSFSL